MVRLVRLTASNLWMSPYSNYQMELFQIILNQHEVAGRNFKQISDWLNDNNYKTPRGHSFTESHLQLLSKREYKNVSKKVICPEIQADFWNGDPDIDALCRLEHAPECK